MLVTFDFDGTLVDSMPVLCALATSCVLARTDAIDQEKFKRDYYATSGAPFSDQLAELVSGQLIALNEKQQSEAVADFERAKRAAVMASNLFLDVEPAIDWLRNCGVRLAVVSSSHKTLVSDYLVERGLDWAINFISGGPRSKSEQLQRLALDDSVLFVGDSWKDAVFAGEARVRFAHVDRVRYGEGALALALSQERGHGHF